MFSIGHHILKLNGRIQKIQTTGKLA